MVRRITTPSFHFTETEPTPLVKDFDTFLQYVKSTPPSLGKSKGYISYKHLVALNEQMSNKNTENTPRTPQPYYPQLHLYYHIGLAGKLLQKNPRGSSIMLEATDRLDDYRRLSATEKYFFQLETLWVDCPFSDLTYRRGSIGTVYVNIFLENLSRCKPGKRLYGNKINWIKAMMWDSFFIRCFSLFGWYDVKRDEKEYQASGTKSAFPVASLKPSSLGVHIAKILLKERPYEKWNIPYRRTLGEYVDYPGGDVEDDGSYEPFIVPFRKICEEGELRNTLPRKKREGVQGNFVFKVSLGRVWRTIALSSEHTMDQLHLAIQDAFDFDADHLYAFFMDNRLWSDYSFESPYSEEGISAADVRIGDVDIVVNQSFLYLFDFGDEWRFNVQLKEIRTGEPLLDKPKILESHGEAPEQYPYYEDY